MFGLGNKKEENAEESGVTYSDGSENSTAQKDPDAVKVEVATTASDAPDTIKAPEDNEPAPLTWREAKALKKYRYAEKIANNPDYKKVFVIRNKRTNQVVELKAKSALQAANIIGWRPRHIIVLDEKLVEDSQLHKEPETTGSSSS